MPQCGHCSALMERNGNKKSIYEEIKEIFNNDDSVTIHDYKYGRDKEASQIRAFPVIKIITSEEEHEYLGSRDAVSISKAIINKKH
jgi:hypothetical protein